ARAVAPGRHRRAGPQSPRGVPTPAGGPGVILDEATDARPRRRAVMIGQRVAAARKLRQMTGRDPAHRPPGPYSRLTNAQAGHVPARQDFIAACAWALQVDPRELTGEPYRGQTPASDRADAAVAGIRAVLLGDALLDPDAPRRSLASLQPALATA